MHVQFQNGCDKIQLQRPKSLRQVEWEWNDKTSGVIVFINDMKTALIGVSFLSLYRPQIVWLVMFEITRQKSTELTCESQSTNCVIFPLYGQLTRGNRVKVKGGIKSFSLYGHDVP